MKNLTIVQKVIFGFSLIFLLFAACLIFSIVGMKNSTASFEGLIDSNFTAARQLSISQTALLEARRAEKELLYADDPLLTDESKNKMRLSYESLQKAKTALGKKEMPDMMNALEELLQLNQQYQKAFLEMTAKAAGQDRMMALLPVRKAGNSMETLTGQALKLIDEDIATQTIEIRSSVSSNTGLVLTKV